MARREKLKRLLTGIAVLIGIGLGGFAVHQQQEKQKMIEIATSEEARKVYVAKFRREDPFAFKSDGIIQSYEIDEDSLAYNPMGGLMVRVTVNHDKAAYINFNLMDNGDGTYHSAYFGISSKLGDLLGY
ncbi:DUF1310 family protein [Streptococcus pantholopis]|uniref:DUF1310 domain-containing protein n=1 Tax=Streptococcus pantholopis TaxID=1811193 RepID=A0A172Q5L9_9STRE|nr:DUF1310 family protein [Streptococcus pantholopis]AND78773.1 hypothetical protein A0O21_01355 [Streptococcus pantholopis]